MPSKVVTPVGAFPDILQDYLRFFFSFQLTFSKCKFDLFIQNYSLTFFNRIEKMFAKIRAVLIDLSGTIHIDSNEIPGSIAALKRFRFLVDVVMDFANDNVMFS